MQWHIKDFLLRFFCIAFIVGVLGFIIWWSFYKYRDCLHVGHTKTYCILDMGK